MPFKSDREYQHRDLCRIELFTPSQDVSETDFGLYANAAFGTIPEDITPEGSETSIPVRIGFSSIILKIDTCDASEVIETTRYREDPQEIELTAKENEANQSNRQGSWLVTGKLNPFAWVGLSGEVGGEKSKEASQVVTSDFSVKEQVYRVERLPELEWRINSIRHPTMVTHLKGPELDQIPLCRVLNATGEATVEAVLAASAQDVWVDINTQSANATPNDNINKELALAVLVGLAMEESAEPYEASASDDTPRVMARCVLLRTPDAEDSK